MRWRDRAASAELRALWLPPLLLALLLLFALPVSELELESVSELELAPAPAGDAPPPVEPAVLVEAAAPPGVPVSNPVGTREDILPISHMRQ